MSAAWGRQSAIALTDRPCGHCIVAGAMTPTIVEPAIAFVAGRRKMRKERDFGLGTFPLRNVFARAPPRWCQAVLAIQWLWSLRMLWVAATNRISECAAALPLRMN